VDATTPAPGPKARWRLHLLIASLSALGTVVVLLLLTNIMERKEEAKRHVFKVVDLTEDMIDPAEWGKNYPRQYDSYKRTVDIHRTRHGGSDAFQKLDEDPVWRVLFKGYAFSADYREERGHAYMLSDQDLTERVKHFQQPGACLHCHSSVIPAYRKAGDGDIRKGFEKMCAQPYAEARALVSHPVACIDCHEPESLKLRVTRPGFLAGIQVLAKTDDRLPHLPSLDRWRRGGRKGDFDVNREASRQELRSLVCAQCHVEYYFKGEGKLLTYPWHKGLRAEKIEEYYDEIGHADWKHPDTGAPMLKAQHPEFEFWSQGIHARSGVSCSDCHMPYVREGAVKISDHHVRSPLLNVSRACQTCHRYPEEEILARAEAIQDRTRDLRRRAQQAVLDLVQAMEKQPEEIRKKAAEFHRKAQWRLDFVFAENSAGFHAPGEAARLLAESIDFARQGMMRLTK
jgi:nitrite reductase (cytochrome c-552)